MDAGPGFTESGFEIWIDLGRGVGGMLGGCLRLADQQSFIQNAAGFGLGLFELVAELPKWSRSEGGHFTILRLVDIP